MHMDVISVQSDKSSEREQYMHLKIQITQLVPNSQYNKKEMLIILCFIAVPKIIYHSIILNYGITINAQGA